MRTRLRRARRHVLRALDAFSTHEEVTVVALFAATAAVFALGRAPLLVRLPFGLLAVLLLPGLGLTSFAFPRRSDLGGVERLALSLGLSLALIAIAAPALDRSPWGLSAEATIVTLTAVTLALTALAAWRRTRLPASERLILFPATSWRGLDPATRRALLMLAAALLVSGAALAATLISAPSPTTEFYLLGPEGRAESYPRAARVGETVTVTAGIVNRERGTASFRVMIVDRDDPSTTLGELPYMELRRGARWEGPVTFVPRADGKDRQILVLLQRDDEAQTYRELRLWLDVSS